MPALESIQQSGVSISGCQFQYHQDVNGFASLVGYDENQRESNNTKTNVTKMVEDDMYQFGSVLVTSYTNIGNYYKCKIHDPSTMSSSSFSSFSQAITVSGKSFFLHIFFRDIFPL